MNRPAVTFLIAVSAALGACGGGRNDESELMRRVAQAEEAANRAEAAAKRAEAAANRAGSGSNSSNSSSAAQETIYEPGPDMDPAYGQAQDPVPEG